MNANNFVNHYSTPWNCFEASEMANIPGMSKEYREIKACWDRLGSRQKEVCKYILNGLTTLEIAERMVVSPETVKSHVRIILDKFALNSRADLRVAFARCPELALEQV